MLLTDKQIIRYDMLSPFNEKLLQSASYDLEISKELYFIAPANTPVDLAEALPDDFYCRVIMNTDGYTLYPGESVLAQTVSAITLPATVAAHARPRTRFTRAGLLVAGQHVNPTFSGKLWLYITNTSPAPLIIKPGMVMAQLVFEALTGKGSGERLYCNKKESAYQGENEFRGMIHERTAGYEAIFKREDKELAGAIKTVERFIKRNTR